VSPCAQGRQIFERLLFLLLLNSISLLVAQKQKSIHSQEFQVWHGAFPYGPAKGELPRSRSPLVTFFTSRSATLSSIVQATLVSPLWSILVLLLQRPVQTITNNFLIAFLHYRVLLMSSSRLSPVSTLKIFVLLNVYTRVGTAVLYTPLTS